MIEDVCCFKIDQASYTSLAVLLKALNPDLSQRIKSLQSLVSSVDTSKKGIFHKTSECDIFMGVFVSEVYYDHTKSVRITLEELLKDGTCGPKFLCTFYGINAEEWCRNSIIKTMKTGKILILLQKIPFQVKTNEIHFHLTSGTKFGSSVWIKGYECSTKDVREKYVYKPLTEAADEMAHRCNLYGVVHSVIKDPVTVKKGRAHGMVLLVDPSCYEDMVKKREFATHIFTSSLEKFPKVIKGDIVRLHRANTEARPGDGRPDFRVFREEEIVVFPWDDRENPRYMGSRFTFSEEDAAKVQSLKSWSMERYKNPIPVTSEPKIITISEIKANESFNLPCRLVDFFDEDVGVALWVEDGTRCPLYTCSDVNIQPYDSQATQDVCNECARICIRCPKPLLSDIQIERQMLLYLRQVEPTCQNCELEVTLAVVQFEVKGGVEKLPPLTRYHKTLMQRLQKTQVITPDPLALEAVPSSGDDELQIQPALANEVESLENNRPEESAEERREEECTLETAIPGPTAGDLETQPSQKGAEEQPKRVLSSDSEVVDSPPANNQRKAKLLIHRSGSPHRSTRGSKSSKGSETTEETEPIPAVSSEGSPRRSARIRKPVRASEQPQATDATFTVPKYPLRSKEVARPLAQESEQQKSSSEMVPQSEPAAVAKGTVSTPSSSPKRSLRSRDVPKPKLSSQTKEHTEEKRTQEIFLEPDAVVFDRDNIPCSSDSTERAMKDMIIPDDVFRHPKLREISPERVFQEAQRLSILLGDDEEMEIPATQFIRPPQLHTQDIAPLEEATFSQVFASTQRVDIVRTERSERSPSPEIPNAQRIFNQSTNEASSEENRNGVIILETQNINSPSVSPSPNPAFAVANEILEIHTVSEGDAVEKNDENQQNSNNEPCSVKKLQRRKPKSNIEYVSFVSSSAESNDELENVERSPPYDTRKRVVIQETTDAIEGSVDTHTRVRCIVRRSRNLSHNEDDEICSSQFPRPISEPTTSSQPLVGILKTKSAYPKEKSLFSSQPSEVGSGRKRQASPEQSPRPRKSRKLRESTSSNDSIELIVDEKRESDAESIIVLDPASQFDMEKVYQAVECAAMKHYNVECLGDIDSIMPGEHFRIKTRIRNLLPQRSLCNVKQSCLEDLLIGVCPECKHVWEYRLFKDSVSQNARRSRLPPKADPITDCEGDSDGIGVINYLCSEEEHDENMKLLAESEHPDISSYDYDENIFLDRSFAFVCPMCKSHGIPDTLCQLKPSFFFWIHLTQKLENGWSGCLHVMASGIHAEYFMGTKADHVLRSSEIWEKTEARLAKLINHEEPITLVVCQSPDSLDEFYLEHTYVVYSEKHVLPWFTS